MDGEVVEHAVAPLAPPRELPFATKRRLGAPAPSKVKCQNIKLRHAQTTPDESSDEEHQQSRSLSPTPAPRLQNKGKTKATSIRQEESPLDTDDAIVEDHLLAVASSDDAPQAGLAAFVDYDSEAPPSSGPPTPNPSADNPPAKPNWHNPLRSGKPLRVRTLGSSLPLRSSPLSTARPLIPSDPMHVDAVIPSQPPTSSTGGPMDGPTNGLAMTGNISAEGSSARPTVSVTGGPTTDGPIAQPQDEPRPLTADGPSQTHQVKQPPMQPIVATSPDSPALNHESARTMLHYLGSLSQDDNYQDLVAQLCPVRAIYFSVYIALYSDMWSNRQTSWTMWASLLGRAGNTPRNTFLPKCI